MTMHGGRVRHAGPFRHAGLVPASTAPDEQKTLLRLTGKSRNRSGATGGLQQPKAIERSRQAIR